MPAPGDDRPPPGRLPAVLRDMAAHEAARLRDGTLPWTWWLERAARFGQRYGFTDTLLIAAQWRAATDVRPYAAWLSAGRQVRKGETAIRLLSPAPGGGLGSVFDIAQTDGLPLAPHPPAPPSEVRAALAALASRHGVPVPPAAAGDVQAVTQLGHRLAHVLAHGGGPGGCHGVRRVEADSVAYLVLRHFGLETGHLRFPAGAAPYAIAGVGDRIVRTARRICAADPSRRALTAAAHRFFRARLEDGWVPGYLAGRGFARAVQRRWGLGYAPPGPRALTDHLRAGGHGDEAIVAAGLARRDRSGGVRDMFRDRAMFPIRTAGGTVAGFIGRRADGGPGPKYLNGPDTGSFHKGELLYGLYESRGRLRGGGARPVVVEGPLDAIAVALAAPGHAAVATLGLSLTAAQLAALGQVAALDRTGLVVALDGDAAGRTATRRLWETLAGVGGPLDAVRLPAGTDPADVLRDRGRAAVRDALAAPEPLIDLAVDAAIGTRGGALETAEERLAAVRSAAAVIARGRPAEAARQVARVAALANVPYDLVTGELVTAVCNSQ
ncbi:toprim domain-containing protein [Spirillospora sp. NPDC029432]|uniref:toprim domain-containing protein n=1 Tax=Spirillospora sp. NPDC029432 TaxID=3154599 RepID=UPI0034550AD6